MYNINQGKSSKKDRCIGLIPRDFDSVDLGRGPGICIFKFARYFRWYAEFRNHIPKKAIK